MFEQEMNVNNIFELRSKTTNYFGCGAINKFEDICSNLINDGIRKLIIVASKSAYKKTGAWDVMKPAMEKNGIEYVLYDEVTPNPTDKSVDEATKLGREFGADAVVGIGGGSPLDTAKSVAIMLEYPDNTCSELYQFKFTPEKAKPMIAINTTHGTGTEVNRFAVVTVTSKEYKPAIAYDIIYPAYAIDDPNLMTGLPYNQTIYTTIDAVNHIIEAATTKVTNPYSIMMAKETLRLADKYLPIAKEEPSNKEARYYLTFASAIAGIAFDNGLLHFTHALEHPLSAIKPELSHGLGLAMILPAVIEAIYPAKPKTLADLLSPITDELNGDASEAHKAAKIIERWIFKMGITSKLKDEGFSENDIDRLVELTKETPSLDGLLAIAPVDATDEVINRIFENSLEKIK